MAKRKTPSLALSEYVSPEAENSTELWRAGLEMIEAVKRIYPKFLETLLAEVFPLYRQLAKEGNAQVGRHHSDVQKLPQSAMLSSSATRDGRCGLSA